MKNILFATTALVATAGIAAADVSISGFAEMGIADTNAANQGWEFHQDIDVTFSMTGETDGGLTFGASVDLDETTAGTTTDDDHGTTVFISGGFGKLTMGDTDGAFDWALTETAMGGSIADDHTAHAGYAGNSGLDGGAAPMGGDGQVLRYDYSINGFGVAVSLEQEANALGAATDDITGFGVTYAMDMGGTAITLGAGMQDAGANEDISGVSVKAAMANGITLVANTSDESSVADRSIKRTGFGIGYTMDALTVTANFGSVDRTGTVNDTDGYGLAVNYDLGGGAVVQLGYGSSDYNASNTLGTSGATLADANTTSIGLALSF